MEYFVITLIVITVITIFLLWQNNSIVINEIEYKNNKVTNNFNNLKILHISDLHNKNFGKKQEKIIKKIIEIKPDIILITGDSIDCHYPKPEVAYLFIRRVSEIAPIYLVSGNHEHTCRTYEEFMNEYKKAGAYILDDKFISIEKNNEKINLFGISDTKSVKFGFIDIKTKESFKQKVKNVLNEANKSELNILLAHRPELIDIYEEYKADLVFSGHAHGGQFRFWFIKGVVAPGQGLFPKYTSGIYNRGNTSMIVSRGLGNSIIPIRIFNRPELVVIKLKRKESV